MTSWISVKVIGLKNNDRVWININNICYIRANQVDNKLSVIVGFKFEGDACTAKEWDVAHTQEELMTMIDKPALLAQLIGDPDA